MLARVFLPLARAGSPEAATVDPPLGTAAAVAIMVVGVVRRYQMLPRVEAAREKGLGEAYNIAKSFARHGTIADAFATGQGPTAHLMPLPAVIGGTVYRLFGIHTPTSGLILTTIALGFVFASFWLLFLCFRELGAPLAGRLLALAIVCLSPINVMLEDIWFRLWDGGIAVAAGALMLYVVLRIDRRAAISTSAIVGLSLLAAVTMFISPSFGIAGYCCCLVLMMRRLPPRRWLATAAIATVALAAVLAPWTIRNARMMGAPIPLRDNFGLELAMANDPSMLASRDADEGVRARHEAVHPWASRAAYAKMVAAGGEVAYSQQLKAEATAWIKAHPRDFLVLTGRHLRTMTFPPLTNSNEPAGGIFALAHRFVIYRVVAGLGFLGMAWSVVWLDRRYRYAVIMAVVAMLPYLLVEANVRYRYIVFAIIAFFASDLVVRTLAWALQQRAQVGRVVAER